MYAVMVREGEVVKLPSGRRGVVHGYAEGAAYGVYEDNGEPWQLTPRLLTFVSGKIAGAPVVYLGESDAEAG